MDRNSTGPASFRAYIVALRKESVDRNFGGAYARRLVAWSLSARRAWIEIGSAWVQEFPELVALRKESVDRNAIVNTVITCSTGRSPQGERG